jgi:hypothetical protein
VRRYRNSGEVLHRSSFCVLVLTANGPRLSTRGDPAEFLGMLALMLGFLKRIAAFGIVVNMLVATANSAVDPS